MIETYREGTMISSATRENTLAGDCAEVLATLVSSEQGGTGGVSTHEQARIGRRNLRPVGQQEGRSRGRRRHPGHHPGHRRQGREGRHHGIRFVREGRPACPHGAEPGNRQGHPGPCDVGAEVQGRRRLQDSGRQEVEVTSPTARPPRVRARREPESWASLTARECLPQGSGNVPRVITVIRSSATAILTRCPNRSRRNPPASKAAASNASSVPSSSSTLPDRVCASYVRTVACTDRSLVSGRADGESGGHVGGARAHAQGQCLPQVVERVDVAADARDVPYGQLARAGRAVPKPRAGAEGGREGRAGSGGVQRGAHEHVFHPGAKGGGGLRWGGGPPMPARRGGRRPPRPGVTSLVPVL